MKCRIILAIMAFVGMMNVFCMRLCLSVVIVGMVNRTQPMNQDSDNDTNNNFCPTDNQNQSGNQEMKQGSFEWSIQQQGLLLGSYYYGYVCSNILGGYLSKRIGIRIVFGVPSLISSLLTLLSPIAANASFELFVFLRILLGFLQGMSFPTMYAAWERWAPPIERTRMTTIHCAGAILGGIIIMPISGAISQYYGWEAVFYLVGAFSLTSSVIWLAIVHDSPDTHPRISLKEKEYIISSIGSGSSMKRSSAIPWFHIVTSKHLWAIYFSHFAMNWGMAFLFLLLPTYLSTVLNKNLLTSGWISSIPLVLHWLCLVFGGWLTDYLRQKSLVRTITIRKINTVIGLVPPGISLVLAGYVGCNATLAVILFTISGALTGFEVSGAESNLHDIAPQFSQICYGVSNTLSTSSGFIVPAIVAVLLSTDKATGVPAIEQWRKSFWIAGAVNFAAAFVYCIFATDQPPQWAIEKKEKDEMKQLNSGIKI